MKSHQHSNPLRAYSGRQFSRAQLMRRPGCTKSQQASRALANNRASTRPVIVNVLLN